MPPAPRINPELRQALETHQRSIRRLSISKARALHSLTDEAADELQKQIRPLAPRRFTSAKAAAHVVQLRSIADGLSRQLGEDIEELLVDTGTLAAQSGRRALVAQVNAQAAQFGIQTVRFQFAADLLDEALLEHYVVSADFYGTGAIRQMRFSIAGSVLRGESLAEVWERMAGDLDISESRAERIVRTEASFATHRRMLEDLKREGGRRWWKQLVTLFDSRTGDDSKVIHGQRRRLTRPFKRSTGELFDHPPDRPNDRGTMIFIPIP